MDPAAGGDGEPWQLDATVKRLRILGLLNAAEAFERFLGTKYLVARNASASRAPRR